MGVLFRLSFFLSRLVSATSSNIAVRCSRLERYCWQLLSPLNIAGSCSRLERSCWQLLSPPAILFAVASLRLCCAFTTPSLRKFLGLSAFDASSLSVRQSCRLVSSVSFASLSTLCHRCKLLLSSASCRQLVSPSCRYFSCHYALSASSPC